jgi:DNA-binding NarL/FixJ family response regulator
METLSNEYGGKARAELQAELNQILKRLLKEEWFLSEFGSGRPVLLARACEHGRHVVLTLVADSVGVPLTERQAQIAALIGQGLGNKGIARKLGISEQTVAGHLKRIYQKLGLHSRAVLAKHAVTILS